MSSRTEPAAAGPAAANIQFISAYGQQVRVSVRPGSSPGKGIPLVLCNGIGAALEVLQPLLPHLDPTVDLITFDVPGVGGSPVPLLPYRFGQLAALVMRMLTKLGYGRVDVLGYSWGGALAQQIALLQPYRCRRLVLVGTGTGCLMVPGRPSVLSKMLTPRRFRDPEYAASLAGQLYGGTARHRSDIIEHVYSSQRRLSTTRGYLYQLVAGCGWTSLPFLPLIFQRTLILIGDDDPIIPAVNGRILAGLLPRGELYIYPGGHVELVADPQLIGPLVTEFLARNEG